MAIGAKLSGNRKPEYHIWAKCSHSSACTLPGCYVATLTRAQCAEIAVAFRKGIEETMALADDVPLPDKYHIALLQQVNAVLSALDRRIGAHP